MSKSFLLVSAVAFFLLILVLLLGFFILVNARLTTDELLLNQTRTDQAGIVQFLQSHSSSSSSH